MSSTTIKVDTAVRDRLALLARIRGTTLGGLLEVAADRLETEQRWEEIEAAYDRLLSERPADWADYLDELTGWESVEDPGDAMAVEEWPELNQ